MFMLVIIMLRCLGGIISVIAFLYTQFLGMGKGNFLTCAFRIL